jgi:uncharacterized membrane protein YczE
MGGIALKNIGLRIFRLVWGLFLFAAGTVMAINANLGMAPWYVFHHGISIKTGITLGQASIATGAVLIAADTAMGEKLAWGTISNMALVGVFLDLLMSGGVIPVFENILARYAMLVLGLFVIGIGSYCYIGAGLGAGPRDSLMIALTKKTGKSVRLIRGSIETSVVIIGYLMGGAVGTGTLIMALATGFFVQLAFRIYKFDVKKVKHRFIGEDIKLIKEKLWRPRKGVDTGVK